MLVYQMVMEYCQHTKMIYTLLYLIVSQWCRNIYLGFQLSFHIYIYIYSRCSIYLPWSLTIIPMISQWYHHFSANTTLVHRALKLALAGRVVKHDLAARPALKGIAREKRKMRIWYYYNDGNIYIYNGNIYIYIIIYIYDDMILWL